MVLGSKADIVGSHVPLVPLTPNPGVNAGHTVEVRPSISDFETLFGKSADFDSQSIYFDERARVACFDIGRDNRGYRLVSQRVAGTDYLTSAQHLDSTFKDKGYITQFFHDDKKGLAGITFKKETQRAFV